MDFKKELNDHQILLSVFSKEHYNESIFETMSGLQDKKICYVTLNKPASSLQKAFQSRRLGKDNLFFIDAVSKSMGKEEPRENVIFVSSPMALTELSIAITESLKSGVFDLVLFDSLSTLNVYGEVKTNERFTYSLINKIRSEDKKGIFTCLEEDLETDLIRNSFMCVDNVLKFDELNHQLKKKSHSLALAGLVSLALLSPLLLYNSLRQNNQMTGFAILNNPAPEAFSFLPLIFLLSSASAVVIYFTLKHLINNYHNSVVKPLPSGSLLEIKPRTKQEKDNLKKRFKNKIKQWVNRPN